MRGSLARVVHANVDPAHRVSQSRKPLRHVQRHHRVRVVVVEHAGLEPAGDLEPPVAGYERTDRRVEFTASGGNDRHRVALERQQAIRHTTAQHDPPVDTLELRREPEISAFEVTRQRRYRDATGIRIDPQHPDAFGVVRARSYQGLRNHKRRGRLDIRMCANHFEHTAPIVHA